MTVSGNNPSGSNSLYWVGDNIIADDFPAVDSALRDPDGLLAIGGDLTAPRILDAYKRGIFPWFSQGQPVLWWSPDPRCVLYPEELKISRSLGKTLRRNIFRVTFNQAFQQVIRMCAGPRKGTTDTWITDEMIQAYTSLYDQGKLLSVECWHDNRLAGGLYGLVIGRVFFGESMFSIMTDASKVALVHLVEQLKSRHFKVIDCQIYSRHLHSLGAKPVPRNLFINILRNYTGETEPYNWPEAGTC